MNAIHQAFLQALRASLMGQQAEPRLSPQQWQQFFHISQDHKVLPLVFEAVCACPTLQQTDPAFLQALRRQTKQQVVLQTLRTGEFLELNRRLHAAGVTPIVVKGLACRNLYPRPDHRPSSDEDILIPADQFDRAHRVLLDFGMQTTEDIESAYEVPYRKAGSPLYIELHRHLFAPESTAYGDLNRFFDGVFDRVCREGEFCTMGPTDHMFYLICHAFKHFLHSGFGIRQVCDIMLYANHFGSRIDWDLLLSDCRAIRAEKFAAALFRIGRNYLTFDPEKACLPACWQSIAVDESAMLADLLDAGVYGGATTSRRHSSSITLDAVTSQNQGRKQKSGLLASVFPPARQLRGRYPYLKKHPILLPVAWCQRLWHYARSRKDDPQSAADALKLGRDRVQLLREYGILD